MNMNITTAANISNSVGESSAPSLISRSEVQKMVERRNRKIEDSYREIKDSFLQCLSFEIVAAVASGRNCVYVNFSEESDHVEIGGGVYYVEYQRTGMDLNDFVREIKNEIMKSGYSVTHTTIPFRVSWK